MGKGQSKSYDLVGSNHNTNGLSSLPRNEKAQPSNTMETMETVEAVVCNVDDMTDGEMKEVDLGEGKVLLVKDKGQFHAIGAKCSHYGAPLIKGVYYNGRVRCPWHGACFNVSTGDIEDYPGLDSLPKFEVDVSAGKVMVRANKKALMNQKRQKSMCRAIATNNNDLLIIGGGPASVTCAQTLRQEGFSGQITIVTKEHHLPYDRPKLSKAMDSKADSISLRDGAFYESADIHIHKGKEAVAVDTESKQVMFEDGSSMCYHSLLLATGGRPRTLPIPGADLQNVCLLRTPDDANYIAETAKGKNVVIIGSSFIGMEVANNVVKKANSVSVLVRGDVPFKAVLGKKIGAIIQKMHEDKGVIFHFNTGISEFVGDGRSVKEAVLSDGTRLQADLCVLGVGVMPATDFLKSSQITMSDRGFITVDKYMQTSIADIYAAGDIVEFPLFTAGDQKVNVSHWQMAHAHGRTVAFSILGREHEIRSVPYFWTVMYGKSIRYTGYGPGYDDIVVHGDLDEPEFVAYYTKDEEVVAVASLNFDPIVSQAAEFMAAGKKILKAEIQDDPHGWLSRL